MDNQDILSRLQVLENKLAEKERQQISYPLDKQSLEVLDKYYMHITQQLVTAAGAGRYAYEYIGRQGNGRLIPGTFNQSNQLEFILNANLYNPYTVNVTTNYITTTGNYENTQIVNVSSTGSTPSPLINGVDYYVINSTGQTFQLSLTSGGAAIDITDAGTGSQYLFSIGF
jgi:hypothetical protein